jgi:hypothetical protein
MNHPGQLQGMQMSGPAYAFNSTDVRILRDPLHLGDAGADHLTVQNHAAAAALALVAANLGSSQIELIAQDIGQAFFRINNQFFVQAVDHQGSFEHDALLFSWFYLSETINLFQKDK